MLLDGNDEGQPGDNGTFMILPRARGLGRSMGRMSVGSCHERRASEALRGVSRHGCRRIDECACNWNDLSVRPESLACRYAVAERASRSVFWPLAFANGACRESGRASWRRRAWRRSCSRLERRALFEPATAAGVERRPGLELGGPGRQLAVLGVLDPVAARLEQRGGHLAVVPGEVLDQIGSGNKPDRFADCRRGAVRPRSARRPRAREQGRSARRPAARLRLALGVELFGQFLQEPSMLARLRPWPGARRTRHPPSGQGQECVESRRNAVNRVSLIDRRTAAPAPDRPGQPREAPR